MPVRPSLVCSLLLCAVVVGGACLSAPEEEASRHKANEAEPTPDATEPFAVGGPNTPAPEKPKEREAAPTEEQVGKQKLEALFTGGGNEGILPLFRAADDDARRDSAGNGVFGPTGTGAGLGSGRGGVGIRGTGAGGGGEAFGKGAMTVATRPAPPAKRDDRAPQAQAPNPGGTFVDAGVNPFTKTSEDRFSTFGIDVDTGSYNYARRFLAAGQRPTPASVRVEEWVNAFHYAYEAPGEGAPFSVHLAGAPSPFTKGRHLLRVGIQGKPVSARERKPAALTFLVDVSGSMSSGDKLPLLKRSLHLLTDQLDERDSISLVTYAGGTSEVLGATPASTVGKAKIHRAIDSLRVGGGTHMSSGMELAYRNAGKVLTSDNESRVIVLSDGDANIGRTSHQQILKAVEGYVSEGITLSTVGFGTGNYRDHLMEQLANAGNGNYTYIDSEAAAKKAFVTDLVGTLQVIAKDVKIQVEMNPAVVSSYRLVGYENRDIADEDFRDDKVDAGEIGAGHTVTALYEVRLVAPGAAPAALGDVATVRIRHKEPRGTKAKEIARTLAGRHLEDRFGDLDVDTRFAAATALAAEVLRGSEHTAHLTLADARALASEATSGPFAEEREEFVRLLDKVEDRRVGVAAR